MSVYSIGNTQIVLEKGDITNASCDAIVNAANEQLAGGAGVCGAIFKAAGWQKLQAACDAYPVKSGVRCPVGESRITDSFQLKSKGIRHILHTPGPDCRVITDPNEQDRLLTNAYSNSLLLAQQNKVQTIAFPFISSAIYAFPKQRACEIALKSIANHLQSSINTIQKVHLVLFTQSDYDLFVNEADRKFNS